MSHATATPDSTAVRTALWRALHLEVDAPPHVLDDRIGLQLAAPDTDWRQRPDMNEYATPGVRASIAARARFIEDLVTEQADHGVGQYVLLGAGLDTFAQRRPEIASRITVFEVAQHANRVGRPVWTLAHHWLGHDDPSLGLAQRVAHGIQAGPGQRHGEHVGLADRDASPHVLRDPKSCDERDVQ